VERPRVTIPASRKYLLVIALFALGLSLIELSEVVELPFETLLAGGSSSSFLSTATLVSLMKQFGYAGLFVLMTLESASLPIPSEVVLPFAGYLVFIGAMNFELALAVSVAAGLVGALLDYYIALFLGRSVVNRFLMRFGVRESTLQRAERWFDGKGAWAVLGARVVPLLRSIISFPRLVRGAHLRRLRCWPALGIGPGVVVGPAGHWDCSGGGTSVCTLHLVLSIRGQAERARTRVWPLRHSSHRRV
jgi:membrane protein YqaA with SNARE-associated domain